MNKLQQQLAYLTRYDRVNVYSDRRWGIYVRKNIFVENNHLTCAHIREYVRYRRQIRRNIRKIMK